MAEYTQKYKRVRCNYHSAVLLPSASLLPLRLRVVSASVRQFAHRGFNQKSHKARLGTGRSACYSAASGFTGTCTFARRQKHQKTRPKPRTGANTRNSRNQSGGGWFTPTTRTVAVGVQGEDLPVPAESSAARWRLLTALLIIASASCRG